MIQFNPIQSNQHQFEEQRESNPAPIVLSSSSDAHEDRSLKMVEELIPTSCSNADNYGNPSSSPLDCENFITNVKKFKETNEIVRTQNDVKDVKRKEENNELKDTGARWEIDHVKKSDNYVLRKLLRGPRYFDPLDSDYGNCYNCGESGHTVTGCSSANRKKPCFLCGSLEHKSKQCKQRKQCFYCKKKGHYAKECPEISIEGSEKAKICLKCGDFGHEMFTCKTVFYSVEDLKEIQCYICKCVGHLCCVEYGEDANEVSCYKCGQLGHVGLKCTTASSSTSTYSEASPVSCYKCGQEGHKSRKCKTFAKRRRKGTKQSNLQDNRDNIGVKSAPQELVEDYKSKINKTNGYLTSSQPNRRGGWMDDEEHEDEDSGGCFSGTHQGSFSTPASFRSNKGFNGNDGDYS